jgi:hypothetical protein
MDDERKANVTVNDKPHRLPVRLKAMELKILSGHGSDRSLVRESPDGPGSDEYFADVDVIDLRDGDRLLAVPACTPSMWPHTGQTRDTYKPSTANREMWTRLECVASAVDEAVAGLPKADVVYMYESMIHFLNKRKLEAMTDATA